MFIPIYVNEYVAALNVFIHSSFFMARREDLQNLDSELEIFLGECWTEETNPDTGVYCTFYYVWLL